MKYFILFLAFLPAALCAVGLIMWVWPKKKNYISGLSARQFVGKWLFIICLGLTLVELGAMKRDEWFTKADDTYYCYRISPDLSVDTTVTDTVNVVQDSVIVTTDSVFTYVLPSNNPNVIEIPFITNCCGNARYITVNVGTAKIKAMFDTGCEYAICLTYSDYYKVVGTGMVEENKFTGKRYASIADGSTMEVVSFKLPVCNVGMAAFTDVNACVIDGDATLVGNPIFTGYQITIDDANKKLILKKNDVPSAAGK